MKSVFENYVTTVGTNGTMSFPLLDAQSGGLPLLVVGPDFTRNTIRFFVKMPDLEEAMRLPAPMKYDRSTVTFEPVMLYLDGPLPPHCTMKFHRVVCGKERGKLNKAPAHLWEPQNETAIYPANRVQAPTMRCGNTIEFEGVSFWFNSREQDRKKEPKRNIFHWPPPPEPPPPVKMTHPVSLMLLVKMHWIPKGSQKKSFRIVNGSPVDWAGTPMTRDPIEAERVMDPVATPGSHGANDEEDHEEYPGFSEPSWAASSRVPRKPQ